MKTDFGVIGLAVMGRNLVLNFLDHGYSVGVYNRTPSVTRQFKTEHQVFYPGLSAAEDLHDLVRGCAVPRKILIMVKAGEAVDAVLHELMPLLDPGDIVMDGGNSLFTDTARRLEIAAERNIHFVGLGISGGEEGARKGPSLMPGGNSEAWPALKGPLQDISAKAPEPCCDWIGPGGSGHFVKMIHNGIEYGDIQLLCESWDLMHRGLGLSPGEAAGIYTRWNTGHLESYLVEITGEILAFRDTDGVPMVEKILDTAGQKGTGKWSVFAGLDLGVSVPLMAEAVFSRSLSSIKEERVHAAGTLIGPATIVEENPDAFIEDLEKALLCAKILSYAQGFAVLSRASREFGWNLDPANIASLWRGGCIIRSGFLDKISSGFSGGKKEPNLMTVPYFRDLLASGQPSWRKVVTCAVRSGLPVPALSSALAFYDGYRSAVLPTNLLQALRDFFGGHRYERVDAPRGEFFHTAWFGKADS